ncbi:Tigger transposable element-derived protein 3 [Linnemannia elongata]|nr:Tigger transposable element-derived protein 3 [Linnemannia elongata]
MPPEEPKTPTESSTPSPVSQKRGADTPVMNSKAKEDVAEEEDRKSPGEAHTGNQDEEEEEEEERNNGKIYLSWAEELKAYRDNEAKWDRIKKPVEAALHRWFVKEYERGTDIEMRRTEDQAAVIWTEMKPFLRPLNVPEPYRVKPEMGGCYRRLVNKVGRNEDGCLGEPRSAEHKTYMQRHLKKIQHFLREFRLEDIYSCMETAMYLRTTPYSNGEGASNASSDLVTGVVQTPRVSILLCANATGEDKRKLSVFSKRRNLYLRSTTVRDIDVALTNTGFMTARIFSHWLQRFDRDMGQQGRCIALMYNHTSITNDCRNLRLKNITLVRLPLGPSLHVQALELHVDRYFKFHYCKDMLEATKPELEVAAPPIPEADLWPLLATSWDKVDPSCIRVGFRNSEIMTYDRSWELDALGLECDNDTFTLWEDLENRYTWWVEMPGRYQALDYLDILFSEGPTAPTLEAVQETLDSGEYKDLFFDRRGEGLVLVGDDYGIVEDAPWPATEKSVIKEGHWGAEDKERYLSCLEKLSGFGTGMMRDKIQATPELRKRLLDIHQALDSLTGCIEQEQ